MDFEETKSASKTLNDSEPSDEETKNKPVAAQATIEVNYAYNQAAASISQAATVSEFESITKKIGISEPVEDQKVDEELTYEKRQPTQVGNFDSSNNGATAAAKD